MARYSKELNSCFENLFNTNVANTKLNKEVKAWFVKECQSYINQGWTNDEIASMNSFPGFAAKYFRIVLNPIAKEDSELNRKQFDIDECRDFFVSYLRGIQDELGTEHINVVRTHDLNMVNIDFEALKRVCHMWF